MKPKKNYSGDIYVPSGIDACQTPPYALVPLLPYLRQFNIIWEPAAGEGYLVKALQDNSKYVIYSDILTGQNFFDYQPHQWDVQVTNPPYGIKYKWLKRSYELGKPFALLLPVETLGAKTAQNMFRLNGLEVIFLGDRVAFKMPRIGWENSHPQFPTAWFCYGLNIGQQMTFAEIVKEKM